MILVDRSSPERPVQRSVPADEWTGGEEQEPQHGQAKVHPVRRIHAEPGQATEHVHEERARMNWRHHRRECKTIQAQPFFASLCVRSHLLTHPKVVHDLHSLLELYRNVHRNVVVETRANRELLWQRRPVVFTSCAKQEARKWLARLRRHDDKANDGRLTDLLPRGTVALSPDGPALLLFSPAPPASSTTQPEHALGPDTNTHTHTQVNLHSWRILKWGGKLSKEGTTRCVILHLKKWLGWEKSVYLCFLSFVFNNTDEFD